MKFYEVEFLKNNQNYTKTIKAENLNIAQTKALSKNWKIIDIKEIQKSNFQRLKDENFILFFKELALLCEVGLSVQEAIKELYLMHSCKIMKKILDNLILAQNLNQAFENANFGLNRAELALIKTAEKTGKISEVFSQISKLREKSLESQKQLKKAFRYPTLVFLSIIGAFLFLMLFVVPNFKDLFENLGASLPFITHVMLEIYNFLDSYGIFCIFLFVVFIVMLILAYKNFHSFAFSCDFLFLKIPLISRLIIYNQNYYFFMVFSLLLKNGISISKAFDLAIIGLENKFLIFQYKKLFSFIDSGLELSQAFKKIDIFDSLVFSMLSVAMKSGRLEVLSEEIAKYYQQKSENLMDRFLVFLEHMMTLFVAFLVLFLALGIFLPMWELSSGVNFN
ncbi:type II secretion system F family protein [Campylobacter jejuni]|uniref:Type II secretion system F family protein n=4 Tax=Campylobacter jejuni TaxID=197 RepID=A0A5T1APB8_CAMJU|nr:type II secretion system F family protein [Campylobacter jejuni]ANS24520.1 transformation system, type II secretion system membrane protein CtsF [Campylobacter jejuni subsp. jejuni]AOW97796.1 transformation system, type II secretion system membrane protein CtsF [Campylobacter jejuni subsp. jejuni str. RM3420]ASI87961.1 Type II secretion system protein [Campylobacter jejuni]EAH4749236.1 type II secretion system F family protein [Campylobacter jejuni]EAH4909947.1 type II secretion system F fa